MGKIIFTEITENENIFVTVKLALSKWDAKRIRIIARDCGYPTAVVVVQWKFPSLSLTEAQEIVDMLTGE